MKRVGETESPISGVNITPVIDVSLVLLLIILVSSPILNIPNIPVNLPQAVTTEAKEQNITVSMGHDGRISVDSDIVPESQVVAEVAKRLGKRHEVLVIIRADKDIPYRRVESILEVLTQKVGARNVAVATQQKTNAATGVFR